MLVIGLTLAPEIARAQTGTFTQNGTWTCDVGGHWSAPPAPPPVNCPTVPFPKSFGGTPTMTVGVCYPGGHCATLGQDAPYVGYRVTPSGFAPYLSHMGRGAGASIIVQGTWIAVGPPVPSPQPTPPQDETFTQIGTWTCDVGGRWSAPPAPPPVNCPTISFPKAFRDAPTMTVGVCDPGGTCSTLFQDAPYVGFRVSPTGFSPYLSHQGRGAGASIIDNGTWVAVGHPVIAPAPPPGPTPPTSPFKDDTFVQNGTWTCDVGGNWSAPPAPPPVNCPTVNFAKPFGGAPTMTVGVCYPGGDCATLFRDAAFIGYNETATGFSPYLSHMGKGGGGSVVVNGSWVAVGPKLHNGQVIPKYIVLTVIYAPPGTNGGHSTSGVSYAAGSSTGTTTSASQTFTMANTLSFEGSGGFLGNGGGAGLSFDWSHSATDSQSLEIKKSTTSTISRNGPAQDGVNHDEDAIYLGLNPKVDLKISSAAVSWLLTAAPSQIQYVYVGWLNGHVPMPANIAAALNGAGITPGDYPDILARDPLASGVPTPDQARFQPINVTFPYEPPYSAADPVPTTTTVITDASTQTTGVATEDTFKVGLTISTTGDYLEFAKATLKDFATWQWTNKSSVSSATGQTQSASLTIGGPSFGYTGPTQVQVYEDTVYHTFAFALAPVASGDVALRGLVRDSSGKLVAFAEVMLDDHGVQHRTFTNQKGQYVFDGAIRGPVAVQALGTSRQDVKTGPQATLEIRP